MRRALVSPLHSCTCVPTCISSSHIPDPFQWWHRQNRSRTSRYGFLVAKAPRNLHDTFNPMSVYARHSQGRCSDPNTPAHTHSKFIPNRRDQLRSQELPTQSLPGRDPKGSNRPSSDGLNGPGVLPPQTRATTWRITGKNTPHTPQARTHNPP